MPDDPLFYALFHVCPAGYWPAVLVLTLLGWLGPGGPLAMKLATAIGNAVGAAVAGAMTAVVQIVFTCITVGFTLIVLFAIVLVVLAWMRDN